MGLDQWGIDTSTDDEPSGEIETYKAIPAVEHPTSFVTPVGYGVVAALVFGAVALAFSAGIAWLLKSLSWVTVFVLSTNLGSLVGGAFTLTVQGGAGANLTVEGAAPGDMEPWAVLLNLGLTLPGLFALIAYGLVLRAGFARISAPTIGHVLYIILVSALPLAVVVGAVSAVGVLMQTPLQVNDYTVWIVPKPLEQFGSISIVALVISGWSSLRLRRSFTYNEIITKVLAFGQTAIQTSAYCLRWLLPIAIPAAILSAVAIILTIPDGFKNIWMWMAVVVVPTLSILGTMVSLAVPAVVLLETPTQSLHASFSMFGSQGSAVSVLIPQLIVIAIGCIISWQIIKRGSQVGVELGLDRRLAVVSSWVGFVSTVVFASLFARLTLTVEVVTATTPNVVDAVANVLGNGMSVDGAQHYALTLMAGLLPGVFWMLLVSAVIALVVFFTFKARTDTKPEPVSPYVAHLDALLQAGIITEAEYLRIRIRFS